MVGFKWFILYIFISLICIFAAVIQSLSIAFMHLLMLATCLEENETWSSRNGGNLSCKHLGSRPALLEYRVIAGDWQYISWKISIVTCATELSSHDLTVSLLQQCTIYSYLKPFLFSPKANSFVSLRILLKYYLVVLFSHFGGQHWVFVFRQLPW